MASIGFHYSLEVAASRHNNIWFKELGSMSIKRPNGAAKFLEELFYDLWILQTVGFVNHQFNCVLKQGADKTKKKLQLLEH